MKVLGRVFVVTGAGNGMGREVALEILRRGGKVAGVDLNGEWLAQTAEMAGATSSNFSTHTVNIADRDAVAALPSQVIAKHGTVDSLVNVAGIIQPFVRVNDLDMASIDRVMSVNFFGVLNLVKAFLPELLKRDEAHILNVSSMGSYAPVPGQTIYGASKAAINLLSEGLRSELKETRVAVTVVYPGAIGTNIAANSGLKMDMEAAGDRKMKVVAPKDAGRLMVDAIEKGSKRIYIGSDATLMARLNRMSPDLASNLIYKGMKDLLK